MPFSDGLPIPAVSGIRIEQRKETGFVKAPLNRAWVGADSQVARNEAWVIQRPLDIVRAFHWNSLSLPAHFQGLSAIIIKKLL